MNFFTHQPELLSTINVILGSKIGAVPATVFFGLLFLIALLLGFIFFRRTWSWSAIILSAAAIAWLPLFTQFVYSSAKEFNETWFMISATAEEQIIWRHCRIDKNQKLGGGFCGLYPFVEKIKASVPKGKTVAYADAALAPYLMYYLFKEYKVAPAQTADYFVLFRPVVPYIYENGILYKSGEPRLELGKFELIVSLAQNQAIFKRIK
jgi:hypothetical protein